jgi:hypothetical protein
VGAEEKQIPPCQQWPETKRERQAVGWWCLRDRRHQESVYRVQIGIIDMGEMVIGESGVEIGSISRNAALHRPAAGVMLEAKIVPNGVGNDRSPAKGCPFIAVWQTGQSPMAASLAPRSISTAGNDDGSGRSMSAPTVAAAMKRPRDFTTTGSDSHYRLAGWACFSSAHHTVLLA